MLGEFIMAKKQMSRDGFEKLQKEYTRLVTVRRAEVAQKLKEARAFGDLSENAEYDEAKKEQAFIEGEIIRIEKLIKDAEVIDESTLSNDVVNIGSFVKVYDYDMDMEDEYQLVGSTDVDPDNNKISYESPIGAALLHKAEGDVVSVTIPDGVIEFKILKIYR
jgi:transcription elongation factor GreA